MMVSELRPCTIEGYWCHSPVRLARPVRTPLGSRTTVLTVCVDIGYSVHAGEIVLHGVELTQPQDTGLEGCNVASKRGEAFRATRVCPESELVKVIMDELCAVPSHLGRLMLGKWRDANPDVKTPYLAEPFKVAVSCLSTYDRMGIGRCEACGKVDLLTKIQSGQLVCQPCLQGIRGT